MQIYRCDAFINGIIKYILSNFMGLPLPLFIIINIEIDQLLGDFIGVDWRRWTDYGNALKYHLRAVVWTF